MAAEKALALVVRTTDWSETSRIATLWSREFGRLRVLAKGGRRLKSNFESALDLLSVVSIVWLRKSSGGLDLLTEARVVERFPRLRTDLAALYAAYYVAELLSDWTEDLDPHPGLFDEALATLRDLGSEAKTATGPRLARFELVMLRELGFAPGWERCAACGELAAERGLGFSPSAGGLLCGRCPSRHRDRRPLSADAWRLLRALSGSGESWRQPWPAAARAEVRQLLGDYVTWLLGRRPRLLPYLGS
jgi:DNA repair protein RecO (recombination protein O)